MTSGVRAAHIPLAQIQGEEDREATTSFCLQRKSEQSICSLASAEAVVSSRYVPRTTTRLCRAEHRFSRLPLSTGRSRRKTRRGRPESRVKQKSCLFESFTCSQQAVRKTCLGTRERNR